MQREASFFNAVNREHVLGQVDTNIRNLHGGRPFRFKWLQGCGVSGQALLVVLLAREVLPARRLAPTVDHGLVAEG